MNETIKWLSWLALTRHWLSLVGVALVTTAVISRLFVLPIRIRGHVDNPYVGIVIFLILPALFFTGLLLIPIGIYAGKRQIKKGLEEPSFDRKAALRRLAWFFGVTPSSRRLKFFPGAGCATSGERRNSKALFLDFRNCNLNCVW